MFSFRSSSEAEDHISNILGKDYKSFFVPLKTDSILETKQALEDQDKEYQFQGLKLLNNKDTDDENILLNEQVLIMKNEKEEDIRRKIEEVLDEDGTKIILKKELLTRQMSAMQEDINSYEYIEPVWDIKPLPI